jgi:hypothetical protein
VLTVCTAAHPLGSIPANLLLRDLPYIVRL